MNMNEHKATYNIPSMRLLHIPTVTTCGQQFAVWTDVKELLLWCADTHCGIVLDALNHVSVQTAFVHQCSIHEQLNFSTQFVHVKLGTCLVNIEILRNPEVLSFLHAYVRNKHMESKYPEVWRCTRMLQEISAKYTNTSFKIPLRMASNMALLPAFRRSFEICSHDGNQETYNEDKTVQSSHVTSVENTISTLVPMGLLADMYPECVGCLNKATRQYLEGFSGLGTPPGVYQCTVEEGILLTRFISSYRGYDGPWNCFTSNSLLMSWTEFWNRLDSVKQNNLFLKLSNTGMIILNSQAFPDMAAQNTTSLIYQPDHHEVGNEDLRSIGNHTARQVQDSKTVGHRTTSLLHDIQPAKPQSTAFQQRRNNWQQGSREVSGTHSDVLRNTSKAKQMTAILNHTEMDEARSGLSRQGNMIEKGLVTCKGRKLISSNETGNMSVKKGIHDKSTKDKNNSATKKGIEMVRPGSGDTTETDVNYKTPMGKDILSVNKLSILKSNARTSHGVEADAKMVQTDKHAKGKYEHIFVPVCDNDSKAEYSITEVTGYDLATLAAEGANRGIHVSITPKRDSSNEDQYKQIGPISLFPNNHVTKRKDDVERKYLKLSKAFINDDMPVAIRVDGKAPSHFAARYGLMNEDAEACRKQEVNDSVKESDEVDEDSAGPQSCDNFNSNDKQRYTSVTPIQLELTSPMLKGIEIDPNVIQESRKFPYKPVRNDHKQSRGSPVILRPNLVQDVSSCKSGPVIEGTQIRVKSAAEKPTFIDKSYFHPQTSMSATFRKPSTNELDKHLENQSHAVQNHEVPRPACHVNDEYVTPDQFVATGKVVKTFDRQAPDFDSSEFMKERITMWRDSVEKALHPNKTERLTKSAGVRRSRQVCMNRPMSSIYFSPGTQFERENHVISPSKCSALAREIYTQPHFTKQSDNEEKNNHSEPVQQRKHVEVNNYGSSSSTTPDIYDEFARKRRPKLLKPDTVQIKPKPVTRPIPTTLCQPIIRKAPPQTVAQRPSSQNYNTVGYTSSNAGKSKVQTTSMNKTVEDMKPCLKQTYRHSDNVPNHNVYHDSKVLDLKQQFPSTSTASNHTNSNTSCSYSACSMNRKETSRKIPSAKDSRKAFVPEFCTLVERPKTAKSSSTVASNSSLLQKFGVNECQSKSDHFDKMVTSGFDAGTELNQEGNTNATCSDISNAVTGFVDKKKSHLLEQVTSFVNSYVSPNKSESLEDINSIHAILSTNPLQVMSLGEIDQDIARKSSANQGVPRERRYKHHDATCTSNLEHKYKYLSLQDVESGGQFLSKVDSQLFYKVPEDEHYHRVTGNMVIPPHAQFFIQSRGSSEVSLLSYEKFPAENKTEYTDQLKEKYIESFYPNDGRISSQVSITNSNEPNFGTGKVAEPENGQDSIFDQILRTSNSFEDKAEQMKQIILETEQAIQNVDELEDDEELTSVSKGNSEEVITSTNLQENNLGTDKTTSDPSKVVSPIRGLEFTKRFINKQKSFKEVVEEKRAQRKKTENELSKKRFWNSAQLKTSKTEPILDKLDKGKPKPSQKDKRSVVNSRENSAKSKSQQSNASSNLKSSSNESYGKKVEDISVRKKCTTINQRPKTSETKVSVKERQVKSYSNVTNIETNKSKSSSNAVKPSISSTIRKQRASKSARQFPRSYSRAGQKNGSADDCTNKILTALRRLSIEKPQQETDVNASQKLDARQRKLRSCVVDKITGQKGCTDNKTNVEKGKTERVVKGGNKPGKSKDLKQKTSSARSKSSTSQKSGANDNSTRECYVSLEKLNETGVTKEGSSGKVETACYEEDRLQIDKTKPSSSSMYCDQTDEGGLDKQELDERTFITKFDVSEINRRNEYGDNVAEDVTCSDDRTHNGEPNIDFLTDANVNCQINVEVKATCFEDTTVDVHTDDENPVQIFLNASEEQYALPQTEMMNMCTKTINSDALGLIKLEEPDAAETVYSSYEETPNRNHMFDQDVGTNMTEEPEIRYDKRDVEETFLYAEEIEASKELPKKFVWVHEQFTDGISTSHAELVSLDNHYHDNVANFCENSVLLSQNNFVDEKGFPITEQQVGDGHLTQDYLGLQIAWSNSEHMLDNVNETRTASNGENGNTEFIDETECGEEVYVETDDAGVHVMSSTEALTSAILCNDVYLNQTDDLDVGKSPSDILHAGTEINERPKTHCKDESSVGKSKRRNRKRLDSNDSLWVECDKEKCSPEHSPVQFIGDTSIFSGKLSPTQSEMEEYFAKVAERAGLNPFLDNCLDDMTEKSADINKVEFKIEKHDSEELPKKDKKANSNNADKDGNNLDPGYSESELDVCDSKSDVADKDYEPDVESSSDTEGSAGEDLNGEPKSLKVKTKSKSKRKSKIADRENESKKKQINDKEMLAADERTWNKYLKDSYACDEKTHQTKKAKKSKKGRNCDDESTLSKLENSIVRDYCLKNVGSEETLAQLKGKLWKDKYLANEIDSSMERRCKDLLGNGEAENASKKPAKQHRKKSKTARKSRKATDDIDEAAEEDKIKEREEVKAAEGFIKTQKLYFNILKKLSIDNCKQTEEDEVLELSKSNVEELPSVLEGVAVHGDRCITKAETDAEKALEGTGSLDDILNEDEGTIVEDLTNQCRYQLIEDEDHVQLGGIAYFKDFQLPFVYINGYKYTPVKDALRLFQTRCCISKCTIPRNTLQKYKMLVKSFSTWEQVYKLELIKLKKGPTVKTGDMLVKLDSLLSLLPDLIGTIIQQHKGTKLKNSQACLMEEYKKLLILLKG